MENITIGQIAGAIGTISVLGGFFFSIYKFVKKVAIDKIDANTKEIENLKNEMERLKSEVQDSKEERLILLKGQLACLKGLKEQGCDGPVSQGIEDIEEYILRKSHD